MGGAQISRAGCIFFALLSSIGFYAGQARRFAMIAHNLSAMCNKTESIEPTPSRPVAAIQMNFHISSSYFW
jgi:hypothetical protein